MGAVLLWVLGIAIVAGLVALWRGTGVSNCDGD